MMAVAVALAITSCNGNSSTNSTSDSISSVKSETVEDSSNTFEDKQEASAVSQTEEVKETANAEPTGDAAKDAQVAIDKCLEYVSEIKTIDDMNTFRAKTRVLQDKFEGYYKNLGESELVNFQTHFDVLFESHKVQEKLLEKKAELEKTMSK